MLHVFYHLKKSSKFHLEAIRIYIVPDVGTADEDEWYEVLDQAKQVHVPHEQTHV